MNEKIKRLAYYRLVEAEHKARIAEVRAELEANPLWAYLTKKQERLKAAQAKVADAEQEVRSAALGWYETTSDKKPHPAVQVKLYTTLAYDPQAALDYACEHLPKAIKLDKRAFEKAAKAIEPDFVAFAQEARATIARDLSEYLDK